MITGAVIFLAGLVAGWFTRPAYMKDVPSQLNKGLGSKKARIIDMIEPLSVFDEI